MSQEICILPFFGQGHLLPCFQLCNHLTSTNFKVTLLISSTLSSSIPDSLRQDPLFQLTLIPSPPLSFENHHEVLLQGIQNIISNYNPSNRPVCAIIDVMMGWSSNVFKKFEIPMVAFFTSGACSVAMELALWKAQPLEIKPGEIRFLPGIPKDMALTCSDLKRRRHSSPPPPPRGIGHPRGVGPPRGFGPKKMNPHKLGEQPPWLDETQETIALMINTCDDLEHQFINYIADHFKQPVWGVGPLLPEQYWKSSGSVIKDRDFRPNRLSNVTEEEVIKWLDSKPRGSILYVSFGSEVGPTMEEYKELAQAMESCAQPFIWVVQPGSGILGPLRAGLDKPKGYFPSGLDKRVGNRGLIISGWAPQLLILSHKSTGGFLSHCGWNSTVEAIGRGIPLLGWPIRGDQYHNAKLVVSYFKVGYMVSDDLSEKVNEGDIVLGIQRLMGDEEMKKNAEVLSNKFLNEFPKSSIETLHAFKDYINQRSI